ncbi:uncharacterized protein SCHCODRAFT_02687094 [Schizophyllum commune H4-8]|nr:uncharacterized protein SCHCODRAFT_02687094 [Schizophyllum commune H4-8]KAI5895782.1 hypothetical protein SCHCODRAFT_02687094 [Schizophyllum commune H4-8]
MTVPSKTPGRRHRNRYRRTSRIINSNSSESSSLEHAPPPSTYESHPTRLLFWGPHHNHVLRWTQGPGSTLSTLILRNLMVNFSDHDRKGLYRTKVGALNLQADAGPFLTSDPGHEEEDPHRWAPARLAAMVNWLLDRRCAYDVTRAQRLIVRCCGIQPPPSGDAPGTDALKRLLLHMSKSLTFVELASPWLTSNGTLAANPLVLAENLTQVFIKFERAIDKCFVPIALEHLIGDIQSSVPLRGLDVELTVPTYAEDAHVAARWMAVDKILAEKIADGLLPQSQKLRLWVRAAKGGQQVVKSSMHRLRELGRVEVLRATKFSLGSSARIDVDGFIYTYKMDTCSA